MNSERRSVELMIRYFPTRQGIEIESSGLHHIQFGDMTLYSTERMPAVLPTISPSELAQRFRCVVVGSDRIFSDPFGTIPLYYTASAECLSICSSPERLLDFVDQPLDPAGVWECLLFGSGIWNRTPFIGLRQLPAACELQYSDPERMERYELSALRPARVDQSDEDAVAAFDQGILRAMESVRGGDLIMGISGGIDCRLALVYLREVLGNRNSLATFTFAASADSYEIRYARETCKVLGFPEPELFLLNRSHYDSANSYLPRWTAGQISPVHGHIIEYLRSRVSTPDQVHLSSYYSDAIFGWACHAEVQTLEFGKDRFNHDLEQSPWVPSSVREAISKDFSRAVDGMCTCTNISDVNEYRYILERHPKFHMQLAFCQGQFKPTVLPFASESLLRLSQALPIHLRAGKRIVDLLISRRAPELASVGSSSSREYFYGKRSALLQRGIRGRMTFARFQVLNLVSNLLAWIPGEAFAYTSPFQTENLYRLYVHHYRRKLLDVLHEPGLRHALQFSPELISALGQRRIRDPFIGMRFQLLGVADLKSKRG